MKEIRKRVNDIFTRYVILVLIAIPNLWIFYAVFTPLTIYTDYLLFSIFHSVSVVGNMIHISQFEIEIIKACVGGAAYYLLLVLNLSTPNINFKKRLKILGISFGAFFILNVLRIFVLGLMLFKGSNLFELTHKLFWYAGSTVFVVIIWFSQVKIFKIKYIPFYSDIKFISKQIHNPKSSKKN